MKRLTVKAPSGLIQLKDISEISRTAAVKKLSDYEDLSEQGRLIELPCKVGDKLYEPTNRKIISVYEVVGIEILKQAVFIHWTIIDGFVFRSSHGIYTEQIGKDVFLTKEEAEKKLKGI